jgi:hypothetical protein
MSNVGHNALLSQQEAYSRLSQTMYAHVTTAGHSASCAMVHPFCQA